MAWLALRLPFFDEFSRLGLARRLHITFDDSALGNSDGFSRYSAGNSRGVRYLDAAGCENITLDVAGNDDIACTYRTLP